jgi:hypothetical protein
MGSATDSPGEAVGVLIKHDPWCPLAHGEGSTCASGCRPAAELMPVETLGKIAARDFRNRAQRRAAARAKAGKK